MVSILLVEASLENFNAGTQGLANHLAIRLLYALNWLQLIYVLSLCFHLYEIVVADWLFFPFYWKNSGDWYVKFQGHKKWITGISWEPVHLKSPSRRFVTSSKDGDARIWDVTLRKSVIILSGHTLAVTCVKWGGDGVIYTGYILFQIIFICFLVSPTITWIPMNENYSREHVSSVIFQCVTDLKIVQSKYGKLLKENWFVNWR